MTTKNKTMHETADLERLITVSRAAALARVTRQGIYNAIDSGKLKATLIAGHKYISYYELPIWRSNRKKGFIACK